ncbi:MAG: hypothetical protein HOA60_09280 [Rhodospirillales bacterium]|jgi:hypothetical protein|nr:hypothetical protein [Rhodospirillales bacterium]
MPNFDVMTEIEFDEWFESFAVPIKRDLRFADEKSAETFEYFLNEMAGFNEVDETDRDEWFTSFVVPIQLDLQFADEKNSEMFRAFLYELRDALLGY